MPIIQSALEDHLSFRLIAPVINELNLPERVDITEDCWNRVFDVYTLSGKKPRHVGQMAIQGEPINDGSSIFRLNDRRKIVTGQTYQVNAVIRYNRNSVLCTPKEWSYNTDTKDRHGKSVEHMMIKKKGRIEGNKAIITNKAGIRKLNVDGVFTLNWLLFDAVQRLPLEAGKAYDFVMLDDFDQIKTGQRLYYSKSVQVKIKDRDVILHAFDHVGMGVVPWVYWMDEQGKLLFVVSGLEAFIINTEKSAENKKR